MLPESAPHRIPTTPATAPLVFAGGGVARRRIDKEWVEMTAFESAKDNADLRFWRGKIIIGERSAADTMCEIHSD